MTVKLQTIALAAASIALVASLAACQQAPEGGTTGGATTGTPAPTTGETTTTGGETTTTGGETTTTGGATGETGGTTGGAPAQ
jgi:hypothetical protein